MRTARPRSALPLLVLLAIAGAAAAGPPGAPAGERAPRPGRAPGPPLPPHVLAALDLTAEQRDRVEELRTSLRTDMDTLHQQVASAHDALDAAWAAETPDAAGIAAGLEALGALHTRSARRDAAFRLAVFELLTTAQRARLRASGERAGRSLLAPPPPPQPPPPPPPPPGDDADF